MGEARVGVSVLVFRGEGAEELLLVLRSKAPAEGLWAPPGGRLEFGERLVEAAHREVREESGLTITLADEPLLDVVDLIDGHLRVQRESDDALGVGLRPGHGPGGGCRLAINGEEVRWRVVTTGLYVSLSELRVEAVPLFFRPRRDCEHVSRSRRISPIQKRDSDRHVPEPLAIPGHNLSPMGIGAWELGQLHAADG